MPMTTSEETACRAVCAGDTTSAARAIASDHTLTDVAHLRARLVEAVAMFETSVTTSLSPGSEPEQATPNVLAEVLALVTDDDLGSWPKRHKNSTPALRLGIATRLGDFVEALDAAAVLVATRDAKQEAAGPAAQASRKSC